MYQKEPAELFSFSLQILLMIVLIYQIIINIGYFKKNFMI